VNRILHNITAIGLLFLLASCGSDGGKNPVISIIDSQKTLFEIGRRSLSPGARNIRMAIAQGLVRFDDKGQITPGLAERWVVTDDGLSYVFRIRNQDWSDGTDVNAADIARGLSERLKIERTGTLAADVAAIRDIRAMTQFVVEVRLNNPFPNLLQIMAQPEMGVRVDGRVSGPLNLDSQAVPAELSKLPLTPEEAERLERKSPLPLLVRSDKASKSVELFRTGRADMILGGRFDTLPLVNVASIARSRLRLDPAKGMFGLIITNGDGFLGEAANREALAMAIDRSNLLPALQLEGWGATTRIIPQDVPDYTPVVTDRWQDMDIAERRATARLRVVSWQNRNRFARTLRVAMPKGAGARYLMAKLRADWRLIGIDVQMVTNGSYADLELIDEVARYNGAEWYISQLGCARRKLCDEESEYLLQEARATFDTSQRAQKMAEVETQMTRFNNYIPLGQPIRWSLVRGDINGFTPNTIGLHPLLPLLESPN
jgi:ABC-type transport system substrate-binding protein